MASLPTFNPLSYSAILAPNIQRTIMSEPTSLAFSASQVAPGASQRPVSLPSSVPTVTLRRVGPPIPSFVRTQMQQYMNLLTGVSDVVTLVNLEVVAPTHAEPRHTPPELGLKNSSVETDLKMVLDHEHANQPRTYTPGADMGSFNFYRATNEIGAHPPHPSLAKSIRSVVEPRINSIPAHVMPPTDSNAENTTSIARDRHNSRSAPIHQRASSPRPISSPNEPEVQCQACRETTRKPIFITCGHGFCQECLNRLFRVGTANRASWPPRCCGDNLGTEIEGIQSHLDENILIRYVTVSEEYSNRNPIYCANKPCSHYFEQTRVNNNQGKFIQCSECDTQTCTECKQNSTEHIGLNQTVCKEIQDLMTQEDQKLASTNRWKQCPGCRNLVERIDGCSHMSCGCGVDFCYDCGTKREGWTTACACITRVNPHRRQQTPGGDNTPRRTMRRVLDSAVIPIPRRFRTGVEPNPTASATSAPPAPVAAATPVFMPARALLPDLNLRGVSDGSRTDPPSTTRHSRDQDLINVNTRASLARTSGKIETRASLTRSSGKIETRASTPPGMPPGFGSLTMPTQATPTAAPDKTAPKKPSQRPLRPRLTPQYDNSRPLFSVSRGSAIRSTPVPNQPMPPRRRIIMPRPTEIGTSSGNEASPGPMGTRDKRSHSPDAASHRRNARPSWVMN